MSIASYICDEKPYNPKLKPDRKISDRVYLNLKRLFQSFTKQPKEDEMKHKVIKDVPAAFVQEGDVIEQKNPNEPTVLKRSGRIVEGVSPDLESLGEAVKPLDQMND